MRRSSLGALLPSQGAPYDRGQLLLAYDAAAARATAAEAKLANPFTYTLAPAYQDLQQQYFGQKQRAIAAEAELLKVRQELVTTEAQRWRLQLLAEAHGLEQPPQPEPLGGGRAAVEGGRDA